MPMIRSSNEVYNYLRKVAGEKGEPMSIILDRMMVIHRDYEKANSKGTPRNGRKSGGNTRKRTGKSTDEVDEYFK